MAEQKRLEDQAQKLVAHQSKASDLRMFLVSFSGWTRLMIFHQNQMQLPKWANLHKKPMKDGQWPSCYRMIVYIALSDCSSFLIILSHPNTDTDDIHFSCVSVISTHHSIFSFTVSSIIFPQLVQDTKHRSMLHANIIRHLRVIKPVTDHWSMLSKVLPYLVFL